MNDTLLQVFNKIYSENVLEIAEQPGNDHWENFLFSPNDLETKWTITIRELVFSNEKLQIACKTFKEKKNETKELIEFLLSSADSTSEYPSST
ncbi:hypothetical protein SteCoe_1777 [Stentor coeruleus]|uniref:Uncharacterized protein n=1 Tax=Stentor coeruleus TaxID=5963 RepID=A0A1R2D0Y6_9CILI|nr:hypothetical protein SteCoe_1777 [Stentor coeruleus]